MRYLITTQSEDVHAMLATLALRDRGHEVHVHYGADFPTRQSQSFRVGPGRKRQISVRDEQGEIGFDQADVFWHRRYVPGMPPDNLHPADRSFARRERVHVADSVLQLASPSALWINPLAAATRARLKPVQLVEAEQLGMSVPETLISNDPDEIRTFVREVGRAMYKPATCINWTDGTRSALVFTSPITEADLRNDAMLRSCPGIYQRRVDKAFEVRVTWFGNTCLALRLDSASHEKAANDWRRAQSAGLVCEPIDLPAPILEHCHALMQRMGLVFGCLDFMVTPTGEWVFLEVNEMGQFLWVEDLAPQVPMLDAFVRFLESADPAFRYRPSGERLRMHELLKDPRCEAFQAEEAHRHIAALRWMTADESAQATAATLERSAA